MTAKAVTTKQLRKDMYASIECAAHFHVQVEKCSMERKHSWQFVQGTREGNKTQVGAVQ